jgi:hypothetical protein
MILTEMLQQGQVISRGNNPNPAPEIWPLSISGSMIWHIRMLLVISIGVELGSASCEGHGKEAMTMTGRSSGQAVTLELFASTGGRRLAAGLTTRQAHGQPHGARVTSLTLHIRLGV